jgi:hypothetical protein
MPFPYVTPRAFRDEYAPDATDLGFGSDADYNAFLDRVLKQESVRVESDEYANAEWRDARTVPPVIYEAVVRLARVRIDSRSADILSSERASDGRQESYRPPADIRADVREELRAAGYGSGDFWTVTR